VVSYLTKYLQKQMKKKKFTRKVTRVGMRSLCLVIPKDIVEDLDLQEKQKMVVYRQGKKIIIQDYVEEE
jgi:bifunctional DNA-binding transcriptional regulator/antitoxin component of YhaV-PrlF toxin-antitoxin module